LSLVFNFAFSSRICGAEIFEYLLEKCRIVYQRTNERNFHVFYELLAGIRPDLREKFGIKNAEKYFYLNQVNILTVNRKKSSFSRLKPLIQQGNAVEIPNKSDYDSFTRLQAAMDSLEFSLEQQHSIFRVLAAILHLGNIFFSKTVISLSEIYVLVLNYSYFNFDFYPSFSVFE